MHKFLLRAAVFAAFATATSAFAAPGDPVEVSDGVTIDPIIDARLRYESVDQDQIDHSADAVTLRVRAGAELRTTHLSFLAEAEGTLALVNDYNAFPFATASHQRRTEYSVVPDPDNVELNRLQLQYWTGSFTLTAGRQRINLDDQRWVGSVGWRQNEQTFDAVRGEAKLGPLALDGTYAWSQRTIFGVDAGPRQAYDGKFVLGGAGAKLGPVQLKAFTYLLDYSESFVLTNSSQTYGARAASSLPLGKGVKLSLAASYARQMNWKDNPNHYGADYLSGDASLAIRNLTVAGGWEKLGSDNGVALQTPLATLHKFNGWADIFLATPPKGLQDAWASAAYKFTGIKALPGLNAAVVYHRFSSDVGNLDYGTEWDASLGAKIGRFAVLAKYADYRAQDFGTDTAKFWLQTEISF